jgi:hypothetical protein
MEDSRNPDSSNMSRTIRLPKTLPIGSVKVFLKPRKKDPLCPAGDLFPERHFSDS